MANPQVDLIPDDSGAKVYFEYIGRKPESHAILRKDLMAFLVVFDAYEVGAILVVCAFVILFALMLNPPTKWVRRMLGIDKGN